MAADQHLSDCSCRITLHWATFTSVVITFNHSIQHFVYPVVEEKYLSESVL